MPKTNSIAGLSLQLLRARGARGWHLALAASAAFSVFTVRAVVRRSAERAERATSVISPLEWLHAQHALPAIGPRAPLAGRLVFGVAIAPSSDGFTAAWVHIGESNRPVVECAALARDGSLRAPPVPLSTSEYALNLTVTRAGDRAVLAWIDVMDAERPKFVPHWAVVDERCRVTLSPRPVGFASTFNSAVSAAFNGRSVAFVSRSYSQGERTDFVVRSLSGEAIADVDLLGSAVGRSASVLPLGADWLVAYDVFDVARVRSTIGLRRVSSQGVTIREQVVRASDGAVEFVALRPASTGAALSWGEDGAGYGRRYAPFLAMVRGDVAATPIAIGPRRTGSIVDLACNDGGCSSAWIGLDPNEDHPQWMTERYTIDGDRARGPLVLNRDAPVALWLAPAIAATASGDAFLSLAPTRDGLLTQRLDREGRPQATPRALTLR